MMLKDWLASRNAYQAMVTADKIEGIWSQQQRYSKYYFDLDLFRAEVLDEVNIEVPILEISRHATLSTHVIVTDRNPDERTHQPNSGPEQDVLTDLRQSKSPGFLVHRQVLDGPTEDRLKEFGWTIVARLADCLPQ